MKAARTQMKHCLPSRSRKSRSKKVFCSLYLYNHWGTTSLWFWQQSTFLLLSINQCLCNLNSFHILVISTSPMTVKPTFPVTNPPILFNPRNRVELAGAKPAPEKSSRDPVTSAGLYVKHRFGFRMTKRCGQLLKAQHPGQCYNRGTQHYYILIEFQDIYLNSL